MKLRVVHPTKHVDASIAVSLMSIMSCLLFLHIQVNVCGI